MEKIQSMIFAVIILLWVDILPTAFLLDEKSEGCLPAGLMDRNEEYAKRFRPSGYLSLEDFSQLLKHLQMNFQSSIVSHRVENQLKDLHLNDSELKQSGNSSGNCSQNHEKVGEFFLECYLLVLLQVVMQLFKEINDPDPISN